MRFFAKPLFKTNLSRYFYKLFFSSVILIAVILLILGSIFYVSFINTFRTEVEEAHILELNRTVNSMDLRFREIDCIAVSMASNMEFDYFNSTGKADGPYRMMNELNKYKASNEFLYDIVYYSAYRTQSNNRIISSTGATNAHLFFKYIYSYKHWSQNQFFNLIKQIDTRTVRPSEPVLIDNQFKTNIITCIYPLPLYAKNPSRVVLFIIEQSALQNMFKNYKGFVYILDENNQLIFSSSKESDSKKKQSLFAKLKAPTLADKVNSVKKVDGINYYVVKRVSDYNNWSYITVTPTYQFMSKVYFKQNLFFISLCLIVIIGTAIAFGLAMRNNKPLQKLLEDLSDNDQNYLTRKGRDDIEYIAKVIDQIRDKNKYLLKEQFLFNLLQGRYTSPAEIAVAMAETDLKLNKSHFLVLIFFIDDYNQFTNQEIYHNTMKVNLGDILGELADQMDLVSVYPVEINDERSYACILNFDATIDIKKEIMTLPVYMKDLLKQDDSFTIGVGQTYLDAENIPNSYHEAEIAVYYRLLKGKNNIIFYEEIKNSQNQKYKYPADLEAALIKAIKQSNQEEITKVILELKKYIINQQIPLESIQCICYGIINAVIKIVDEMRLDASDCFIDEEDSLLVQTFDTVDSMLDRLAVFCEKICTYQLEQKEHKNEKLKGVIFAAINRNLHDNMLSLESLASACGVSSSYLGRYFKQQTGNSLMQYVDQLRMAEVKELLVKTKLSLNEILSNVGYIDKGNFIRKFKKVEGVTPMKYRELHNI